MCIVKQQSSVVDRGNPLYKELARAFLRVGRDGRAENSGISPSESEGAIYAVTKAPVPPFPGVALTNANDSQYQSRCSLAIDS